MSDSHKPIVPPEEDPSYDGNLLASIRPRPADYDPRAPRKTPFSFRELRLKREASTADKTGEETGSNFKEET